MHKNPNSNTRRSYLCALNDQLIVKVALHVCQLGDYVLSNELLFECCVFPDPLSNSLSIVSLLRYQIYFFVYASFSITLKLEQQPEKMAIKIFFVIFSTVQMSLAITLMLSIKHAVKCWPI
jgi:hypothetical protein